MRCIPLAVMGSYFSRKISIIILLCALLLVPDHAFARGGTRLTDVVITNSRNDLLLFLKIKGVFSPKMQRAVFSGVPTTFSFFIILEQKRSLWMDKTLAEITLTHTIKYDNLKKGFTVIRSWENEKPIFLKSFAEAQKMMTEVNGFKIYPINKLDKGTRYRLSAKAKLSKITLPFYLHYILIMASLWDFETEWHSIDFVY